MKRKKTYLAVDDYGQGGIWILVDALCKEDIERKYPKLIVFEDKPEWMTEEEKREYFESCMRHGHHWDVDGPDTGYLKTLHEGA